MKGMGWGVYIVHKVIYKKTIQELKGYRIGLSCTLNALIFFKNVFGLVLV